MKPMPQRAATSKRLGKQFVPRLCTQMFAGKICTPCKFVQAQWWALGMHCIAHYRQRNHSLNCYLSLKTISLYPQRNFTSRNNSCHMTEQTINPIQLCSMETPTVIARAVALHMPNIVRVQMKTLRRYHLAKYIGHTPKLQEGCIQ